ncbi:MAG: hypothetical protein JSU92_15075, partial [Deltaproteobacteria bacterium]
PIDESSWHDEPDLRDPDTDPDDPDAPRVWVAEMGDVNSARLPSYHSLNLKAERKFIKQSWELSLYFEVLNAYYHKNVYSYFYRGGIVEENKLPEKESIYNLPIIPYFGIKAEF